jgi:SAM-dependent methyltransferase
MEPGRTEQELHEHYLIERALADRLRTAAPDVRRGLYAAVYDELFQSVPLHPLLVEKSRRAGEPRSVAAELKFLEPFLSPESVFLEIGAGDCALSIEVARRVKHAYAIEVSQEIISGIQPPANLTLMVTDGIDLPVPDGVVSIAYSNQVMEHLHPDDALEHVAGIYRCLQPGGRYVCLTPNRLTGPHDISQYYDDVATGLHLKEYTASELARLFGSVGFRRHRVYVGGRGIYGRVPVPLVRTAEILARLLPARLRRPVLKTPLRGFLGVGVITRRVDRQGAPS